VETFDEYELSSPADFWLAINGHALEFVVDTGLEFCRTNNTSVTLGNRFVEAESKSRIELHGLANQFLHEDWKGFEERFKVLPQEQTKLYLLNNVSLDISESSESINTLHPKVVFGEGEELKFKKWGSAIIDSPKFKNSPRASIPANEFPEISGTVYFAPWYALKKKKWYNFGNWLSQVLTKYAVAINNFPREFSFILPPDARPWHRSTLVDLGFDSKKIVDWPSKNSMQLDHLLVATDGSTQGNLGAYGFQALRGIIHSQYLTGKKVEIEGVCLSRGGVRHRWSESTLEIEAIFKDFGFQVLSPEDLKLSEQWSLGANNITFGGMNGSNLMTGLFSRSGSRIFEALCVETVAWRTPHWFWQLGGYGGIDYHRYIFSDNSFDAKDFAEWLHNGLHVKE
jgi:hypothetical protein